jgi:hypothetical protein
MFIPYFTETGQMVQKLKGRTHSTAQKYHKSMFPFRKNNGMEILVYSIKRSQAIKAVLEGYVPI